MMLLRMGLIIAVGVPIAAASMALAGEGDQKLQEQRDGLLHNV